ncbi:energy transducer TonB [Fulvivirgaceae bacterium BMA10]|uniref:Energy transducer TonB n=1 Tax=Splendidivirga corallicola TaxID=3051826 RepID=A0ABT8KTL8_9BACT|nr:energy transducer TonB [Fulvivirgaceae bacterium BMA10]
MEPKKKRKADVSRFRVVFFNIGLVLTLVAVTMAFEWKTYNPNLFDLSMKGEGVEAFDEPPPTIVTPPPPPVKVVVPQKIDIVDDDEKIEIPDFVIDVVIDEEDRIEELIVSNPDSDDIAEEIFEIVEVQPSPVGGMEAFGKFLKKNLKYPKLAKRIGTEGKVFVQFVVDKNGKLTEIEVVKGIGAGCDEEAIRVINAHPNWNPGKQRGRPVKVRMIIPIHFKLG